MGELALGAGNQLQTEVLISAVAHNNPIVPGGGQCHHCEHPQLRCSISIHLPGAYTSTRLHHHHSYKGVQESLMLLQHLDFKSRLNAFLPMDCRL